MRVNSTGEIGGEQGGTGGNRGEQGGAEQKGNKWDFWGSRYTGHIRTGWGPGGASVRGGGVHPAP